METLTKTNICSKPFVFSGNYCLCVRGSGSFTVERQFGDEWVTATDENGEALSFSGEGVIFNSYITSPARLPHRIKADTTKAITVSGVSGR